MRAQTYVNFFLQSLVHVNIQYMQKRVPFRERLTLPERVAECNRVMQSRNGYIPTILERGRDDSPPIDKEKYLIPEDLLIGQLAIVVRKRLRLQASEALFLLCNNTLLPATTVLKDLYRTKYNPDDGFLYVQYSLENAFGHPCAESVSDEARRLTIGKGSSERARLRAL